MNTRQIQGIVFVSMLLAPYVAMAGQQSRIDLKKLLELKQSITVEELTDEFTAIKIGDESQAGAMMPYMLFGMMMDGNESDQIEKLRYIDARWSKGDVVVLGGKDFLVTYKTEAMEMMMAMSGEFDKAVPPVFHLDLVNLDNIKTIAPVAGLTPERYKELFADVLGHISDVTNEASMSAMQSSALSSIKQLTIGMLMYATDYDDITPYAQATVAVKYVTLPYIKNDLIWSTGNPDGSKFYFNMAIAGVSLTDVEEPARVVMFYESRAWPDGRRMVSFCDGHARMATEEEWQAHKKTLALKIKKSAKPLPPNYGIDRLRGSPD